MALIVVSCPSSVDLRLQDQDSAGRMKVIFVLLSSMMNWDHVDLCQGSSKIDLQRLQTYRQNQIEHVRTPHILLNNDCCGTPQ